jgi:hypothetical protein
MATFQQFAVTDGDTLNINGTRYSDDVKLEKLFTNNGMSWKR